MKKHLLLGLLSSVLCVASYAQSSATQHGGQTLTTQARISSVEDRLESARQLEQGKPHAKERWATVAGKHLLRDRQGHPVAVPLEQGELRLAKVRRIDSEMARITLNVKNDWGDGSGYQLLLDPDCILYFLTESGHINQIYDEADYKLPADADVLENFLTAGESESVDVPEGEYDFLLFNPAPTTGEIYIPGGMSEGDDVKFVAGYEYVFTMTMELQSDNCSVTCDTPSDLAVSAITSPVNGLDLGADEDVTITVSNVGKSDVAQFEASYTINGGTTVRETVKTAIPAGSSMNYTFDTKADLSAAGKYTIKASADAADDAMTLNNAMTVEVTHTRAMLPPYNCTFEDEDDTDEWDMIDANRDGLTWEITNFGEGIGFAILYYNNLMPSDDYIVMRSPIALTAGDAYMVVVYNGMAEGYTEKMSVLWGTTPDVNEMTELRRFEGFTATNEGYTTPVSFTVPADGNYYFAFHGYSDADQAGVLLNEVTIDQGSYQGTPDLAMDKVTLPLSSCSLGNSEAISATMTNNGTAGIQAFTLTCEINGETLATETFETEIGVGETVTVKFEAKADFSAEDTYEVTVTASDIVPDNGQNEEVITANNAAEATVTHFTPADVPLVASFDDEEQRGWWTSDGSWVYDNWNYAYACTGTTPLISRGVNLEAGATYTVEFNYMAGQNFFTQTYDRYDILCGLDGTDPQGWEVIYASADEYTNDRFVDRSVSFSVDADGVYSVAFRQTDPVGTFSIAKISISKAADHDVAIELSSGLPTMLPQDQMGGMTIDVTVTNRGSETASGTVTLDIDGKTAGTATFSGLKGAQSTTVSVPVAEGALTSGRMRIEATAAIDGHEDGNQSDNTASMTVTMQVTDDILAYDSVSDDDIASYTNSAIGLQSGYIVVGMPVHINKATWLKGLRLGWGETEAKTFDMYLFDYDPAATPIEPGLMPVGDVLFMSSAEKEYGTSVTSYTFDKAQRLEPGDYMLGVGYEGYGLAVDRMSPGRLFAVSEEAGLGWVAYDQASTGLGTAVLRAIIDSSLSGIDETSDDNGDGGIRLSVDGGTLTVTSNGAALEHIGIHAMSGVIVSSTTATGTVHSLDVSSLAAGVYAARIETASGIVTRKFVVR